jgi:hypothetical protein
LVWLFRVLWFTIDKTAVLGAENVAKPFFVKFIEPRVEKDSKLSLEPVGGEPADKLSLLSAKRDNFSASLNNPNEALGRELLATGKVFKLLKVLHTSIIYTKKANKSRFMLVCCW